MRSTVVHFIGSLDRGGAETVALDLCRRIPSHEVRQIFFCLSGRQGRLTDEFVRLGAEVIALPLRPLKSFPFRLHRSLLQIKPDVVVSHVSLASGPLLTMAAVAGVKRRIARFHSQGDGRKSSLWRAAYRCGSRAIVAMIATHVVAVSEPSLHFGLGRWRWIAHIRRIPARVLVNGVDIERFRPAPRPKDPSGVVSVLYVGRAAPEKNRALIVPIAKELLGHGPAMIRVVGPGGTEDLGLLPQVGVETLGERDDVADLMRASDVLLLTSLWEGLPGVVLEALASGIPVVTSDLPGMESLSAELVGITRVSLSCEPSEWASAIFAAVREGTERKASIRQSLAESAYSLEHSAGDWRELWSVNGNH